MAGNVPQTIGPYRLLKLLGRGGMGAVYLAEQASLQREVALKIIKPELLVHAEHRERFRREMTALGRLSHPNVVKVFESGEHDGIAWFAMELVPGRNLAELLKPGKPLPLARVRSIAEGLFAALGYLHEQGLLHRDVKPANIQVSEGGLSKLMDFGLVKDVAGTLVTEEGMTLGTPRYMAPEVLTTGKASVGSDLYQAGVVVYEMLTARVPVDGKNMVELVDRITAGRVVKLRTTRPDLPERLEAIVHELLAGEVLERPGSAKVGWERLSAGLGEAMFATADVEAVAPQERGKHATPTAMATGDGQRKSGSGSGGRTALGSGGGRDAAVSAATGTGRRGAIAAAGGVAVGIAALALGAGRGPGPGPSGHEQGGKPESQKESAAALPPELPRELPVDPPRAGAVAGGFSFSHERLPGRRVTLPRGLAADKRGWVFIGSSEGVSWFDRTRWTSRAIEPVPASFAVLCADREQGVWARLRLDRPVAGTDSFLVRVDETGLRDRVPLPKGAGRPAGGCLDEAGDLLIATSGAPLRRDHETGELGELAVPGIDAPVAGFFVAGPNVGAYSNDSVWLRSGGVWHPVGLGTGGAPGRLRGVSLVQDRLWVCGEKGAVAVPVGGPESKASAAGDAVRVFDGRPLTAAFGLAEGHVTLAGPGGLYVHVPGGAPVAPDSERLTVPGVSQPGVGVVAAGAPGEVWAVTTTPVVLARVTAAGAQVVPLDACDPESGRAELAAAPTLWALPGACIPYSWCDSGEALAAGTRGKLVRILLSGAAPAPLSPIGDEVWPLDLWLPAPGKPLYMVWQKEGTSSRFLDRIDTATGSRGREDAVPLHFDGPVRVTPDGNTVMQGPFVPIVQLLQAGIYVRYHGARPDLNDIQGVKAHRFHFWKIKPRAAGEYALPPDYENGVFTYDAARGEAWYVSREKRVVRRPVGEGKPGTPRPVRFPAGVDEGTIAELEPSPNGTLLAYVLTPKSTGRSTLHVLDLARGRSHRVGSYLYDYAQPRFSPDGRTLAFVRRGVDLPDAQLAVRAVRAR